MHKFFNRNMEQVGNKLVGIYKEFLLGSLSNASLHSFPLSNLNSNVGQPLTPFAGWE